MCTGTWSCSATRHVTRLCYVRQQWDWCATAHWENWSVGHATISETFVCLQIVSLLVTWFEDLLSLSSSQAWSYSSWKKKYALQACIPTPTLCTLIFDPYHFLEHDGSLIWAALNMYTIYTCYISLCLSVCLSVSCLLYTSDAADER